MTPLATLSAAWLVAGLVAAAPLQAAASEETDPERTGAPAAPGAPSASDRRGEGAHPPDVHIEGDVTYQAATGRILVENGAVLRRGAVTIRSRSATYDPETGEVHATGGVLLTDPTRAIRADAIRAVLGGEWEAEGVVAISKDLPLDLGAVGTLEAARSRGRNRLSFSGSHLSGDADGRFHLDDARLTLCDCPDGCAPPWELTSRRADVIPGDRAILSWPVLRITPSFLFIDHSVPVLVLPWLYVPLGDRQTGLLLPAFRRNAPEGFVLSQPLFVTLGRSADATLTAEYAFGGSAIRGPGAALELRWAPAVRSEGKLELAWLHDLKAEDRGVDGDRFALTGSHGQRLGDRTSLTASLQLAGDPVWVRDHHSDVFMWTPYRRSGVLVSRRDDDLVLEGDAEYLQPLQPGGIDGAARPWGSLGAAGRVANRWPGLEASLLPIDTGPLQLSGRVGATRYAPVFTAYDVAGRPATTRADARFELSAPLLLGGALSVAPYVRGAAAGYAFEASRSSMRSAWGVAGVAVDTEISRRFGDLKHAVSPHLEWRGGTATFGDALPWPAYDAYDRAGVGLLSSGLPGVWQQLRASVATRLSRGAADLVRLEVGQDLDLRRGRFAESFVSLGGGGGGFAADASARFLAIDGRLDPVPPPSAPIAPSRLLDRFTELRANVTASDRRGDSLRAGLSSVGQGGSSALVVGMDPLFSLRPAAFDASAGVSAGARAVLGPATIGYDIELYARPGNFGCRDGTHRALASMQPSQHKAIFIWNSPCRCFRIVAYASVNACGEPGGDASIDISQLASARRAP